MKICNPTLYINLWELDDDFPWRNDSGAHDPEKYGAHGQ